MLEGRKAQFIEELMQQDASKTQAQKEVSLSIDRLVYYVVGAISSSNCLVP
jgi:hypothetical protein